MKHSYKKLITTRKTIKRTVSNTMDDAINMNSRVPSVIWRDRNTEIFVSQNGAPSCLYIGNLKKKFLIFQVDSEVRPESKTECLPCCRLRAGAFRATKLFPIVSATLCAALLLPRVAGSRHGGPHTLASSPKPLQIKPN